MAIWASSPKLDDWLSIPALPPPPILPSADDFLLLFCRGHTGSGDMDGGERLDTVEGGEAALCWSSVVVVVVVVEFWVDDDSDVSVGAEDDVDMLLSLKLCELCMPERVGKLVPDRGSEGIEGSEESPLGVCGRLLLLLPAAGPNCALNEWPCDHGFEPGPWDVLGRTSLSSGNRPLEPK